MSVAVSTRARRVAPRGWNSFPVNTLLADGRMQRLFPKLLWLVVPSAYYYGTMITGGFNAGSFIPTAAFVVLLVTSMAVAGGVIAIAVRLWNGGSYFDTARGLIATLLGIWAAALALECLSYSATGLINPPTPANVVRDLLCSMSVDLLCIGWSAGALSHLICALAGALLLATIIRAISRFFPATAPRPSFEPVPEPNVWLAVFVVSLLMRFFDSVITYVS